MMTEEAVIERGVTWLTTLLRLAGLPASVHAERNSIGALEGTDQVGGNIRQDWWLTIDHTTLHPDQVAVLLSGDGAVLDAIQYLGNTILNLHQSQDHQQAYTVELAGYRAQRQVELRAIAEQAVAEVRQTGKEYEIPALSSAERRWIHTYLQTCPDLATESRGVEPDRRLVVRQRSSS
ncbi:MAG: RNA-binding protein [Cyanobacteria bacterium]|nr:RNA-binding protein [Cyanobacteriota bacterium]MDW8200837.1 R3H domain-containing nucleic acid-binding protein [Cyanobacteriota bacterium SKYGB_h_bin112]